MAYKRPTLTETFAELHLAENTLSEAKFFEVVPKLKDRGFTDIEFAVSGFTFGLKQGRPFPREQQRIRCWKPGRTELAQVGEDLLAVNLTGDYPGWDSFTRLFAQAREALDASIPNAPLVSLNLLTIDQFQVPQESFVASRYLNVGGTLIPSWYARCKESLDIDLGHGLLATDGQNRQVHVHAKAASDPVVITLRAEFHNLLKLGEDISAVLDKLHDEANSVFEALITDYVRNEIMGGKK